MKIKSILFHLSCSLIFITCSNPPEKNFNIEETVLFNLLDSKHTNITFSNDITETNTRNHLINFYYYDGGGLAVGDINNDDLPDIYFVGNLSKDKLYLNKGNMVFEDISESSGILSIGADVWGTGVTMADVNGDGFLDIYLCKADDQKETRNLLFINNQDNTFTEKAGEYGLDDAGFATNATFFDYDRDGDLDMYLVNTPPPLYSVVERETEFRSNPPPLFSDKLYKNTGTKYIDVTRESGMLYLYAFGLSGTVGDLNNDGWPDIYVGNDFEEPDYMYINQKNGKFIEVAQKATKHFSNNSMGSDIADFNNDGFLDLFVLDMMAEDNRRQKSNMSSMNQAAFESFVKFGYHYQYMQNVLQMNNGNGTFSDVGPITGTSFTDWSWSVLMADFDNDGWKDIFISNGLRKETNNVDYRRKRDSLANSDARQTYMEVIEMIPSEKISNYMFHNNTNYSFTNLAQNWGLDLPGFSNGSAYADLDRDGDLDLVINNVDTLASIYENQLQSLPNHNYLRIKLEGNRKNLFGIGSRVEIHTDGLLQIQELTLSRGYQSSVEPVIHFGVGDKTKIDTLKITWPDGRIEELKKVSANKTLVLKHENAERPGRTKNAENKLLFKNVTKASGLVYKHEENIYNDFEKEVLLPHKMSKFGPALAKGDIDGDKDDDIFVGGASGYAGAIFIQQENGQFKRSQNANFLDADKRCEDMGAAFFDADNDGDLDLYVSSGGNEFGLSDKALIDRLYLNNGDGSFTKAGESIPQLKYSSSCVKPCDYDKDGDIDLFVGGRLVPGRYPIPASSYLLNNTNGKFSDVTMTIATPLNRMGLVTDAVWVDIDNDDHQDLVIVGEWMPVTTLINKKGKFENKTEEMGLSNDVGWWYSIAAEDFDQDGDMDIVAGNLGLNYKYKATREQPFFVYSDDFDNNNNLDIVLAHYNCGEVVPVRGRECSSQQIPEIKKKFPNYDKFSKASLEDVYGIENLENSLKYEATNFASSYLENQNGNSFKMNNLPVEAQFSSVNGILIYDFNQDGFLDIVLSGNLYSSEVETLRNDASTGLFLAGHGDGSFTAYRSHETGYFTNNDVKNLELVDTKIGSIIISANNDDYMKAFLVKP